MCRPNDYPPYEEEGEDMRYESFGPIANPDGSPTETTLEIMGFRRKVGDTFNWYPERSDYGTRVVITGFSATGVKVNYDEYPIVEDWEIPFSEAM